MVGVQLGVEAENIRLPDVCNTVKDCYAGVVCQCIEKHCYCNKEGLKKFFLEDSSIRSQAQHEIP